MSCRMGKASAQLLTPRLKTGGVMKSQKSNLHNVRKPDHLEFYLPQKT